MANETISGGGEGQVEWALPVFGGYSATGAQLWGFDKTGALSTAGIPKAALEVGLTAHAGGTQAAALALSTSVPVHVIAVCATLGDSVALPPAVGSGARHTVSNQGAASCQVYGSGTDTIDGVATGTGVAIPASKGAEFVDYAAGKWFMVLSA